MTTQTSQELAQISVAQYLQALLPRELPRSQSKDDIAIKQRVVLIVGGQESGKSNTATVIAQQVKQFYKARSYKSKDISVRSIDGENFKEILNGKWSRNPIQVANVEDITDCNISNSVARDAFRIRHVMARQTGRRDGLILLTFGLHAFYDMPISFRRDYSSLIFLQLPMGKSDLQFVEEKIGTEGIRILDQAEADERKGLAVVTIRRHLRAVVQFPRASKEQRTLRSILHL